MPDFIVATNADPVQVSVEPSAAETLRQANLATTAAGAAALSAAMAESAAGPNYANTAAGLSATTDGEAFAVDNGDGTVTIYLNSGGSAVAQRSLATTDALASTATGQGADLVAGAFRVIRATDYGLSTAATAATNLAKLKLAVAACATGDWLEIPPGDYTIDTSGGLTAATEIDTKITIFLRGRLIASTGAIQANPATILNVTADGVHLVGEGSLAGDGTVNSVNTGTDDTMPSLIRVAGDNFTMRGPTIDTPYKIGVHLYGCTNAQIEGCQFTGGPTAYSDTGYFGIRMSNSGGRHTIKGNRFYPGADGGMYVQCVFSAGAGNNTIEGNYAYRPYEKLNYLTGDGNKVIGNTVIGNSGTIPGTNQEGTVGPSYRCDGANNKITNNYSIYGGGAQVRHGGGNDVSDNTFLLAGQSGITVGDATAVLDDTTIRGNTVTCGNLAGVLVTNGISVTTGTGTNRRVVVSDNTVDGFAIADPLTNIAEWQAATAYATRSTIKPTVGNSRYYTTTSSGTSGASEPTWPTTAGNTVVDGDITWTCVSYDATNASIHLDGSLGPFDACTINDNNTSGGYCGLKTASMNASHIGGNLFGASNTGVVESSGGTNQYRFNTVSGAATEKSGIASDSLWVNYATGTFTPVISDGTNNATMGAAGSNTCRYTRIGNQVIVTGNVASTALGSVSGAVRITGLPYAAASGAGGNSGFSAGFAGGLAITAGQAVTGLIQPGNTYIDLYLWDATTGATTLQSTEWTDDGNMSFSLVYHAAP